MNDWRPSTWGDEISLEYGKGIRGYAESSGRVRVFGTNGPVGWTDEPLAEGPGVILGRKGAYRGVHYSPDPFFVIDTAYYVVPKSPLHMRWLYYAMIFYELGKIDDGSPIPSTTRAAVYPRKMLLPPLEEQEAIAAVLGSLDDKIEQNRRTGQKLEALARAVFKAWFVDFEPVKAKAAGAGGFPGMPAAAFAALPTRLVDSQLGPVPEGWKPAALRALAQFVSGGTPSKKNASYWGGDFPWVSAKDMHERFVFDSELRLTIAGRDSVRRLAPRHATLMVVRGMSLLTEVRIGWCMREVAFNQDLRAFVAANGVSPEFLFLWLSSSEPLLMQMVDTASHGTGRILTDRLDAMVIAKPPDAMMQAFTGLTRAMMELCESLATESRRLAALRDYLLPRLLSGKVRVRDNAQPLGGVP